MLHVILLYYGMKIVNNTIIFIYSNHITHYGKKLDAINLTSMSTFIPNNNENQVPTNKYKFSLSVMNCEVMVFLWKNVYCILNIDITISSHTMYT